MHPGLFCIYCSKPMKNFSTLLISLLAWLCSPVWSQVDMPAKAGVCIGCHGPNGNSSMPGVPSLAADEFVVDLRGGGPSALHPLQLEAVRMSGLFEAAGRTFQSTDGRTLQACAAHKEGRDACLLKYDDDMECGMVDVVNTEQRACLCQLTNRHPGMDSSCMLLLGGTFGC